MTKTIPKHICVPKAIRNVAAKEMTNLVGILNDLTYYNAPLKHTKYTNMTLAQVEFFQIALMFLIGDCYWG